MSNAIKRILNAPIVNKTFKNGISTVTIEYNNNSFMGYAKVHPEDKDEFESETVGITIALRRAIIEAFKFEIKKVHREASIKQQMLLEASSNFNSLSEVDPTGYFETNVLKAKSRLKELRKALKEYKAELNEYLKNQNIMIQRLRMIRNRAKTKK